MQQQRKKTLADKYPPSPPCSCKICINYCKRPGWWTVEEAERAIGAGYAGRMMLEISPEMTFGVISPAFKGCESNYALDFFKDNGCTFLVNNLCELHGTGFQPLECRFCHHSRKGLGKKCHADIEKDWNTDQGKMVVRKWVEISGLKKLDL